MKPHNEVNQRLQRQNYENNEQIRQFQEQLSESQLKLEAQEQSRREYNGFDIISNRFEKTIGKLDGITDKKNKLNEQPKNAQQSAKDSDAAIADHHILKATLNKVTQQLKATAEERDNAIKQLTQAQHDESQRDVAKNKALTDAADQQRQLTEEIKRIVKNRCETEKVYKDKEEEHKTDIKDKNMLIELLRSWLSQVKQVPLSLKTLTLLPPPALKTLEQLMETMIPKGIEPLAEGTLTRTAVDTNLQAGGDPLLENPNAEKDHEGAEMKLREEPREEPQQSKESRDELTTVKKQHCQK